jgi:hypothetical protein
MFKSSEDNRDVFNKVQNKLLKFNIKPKQNDIELILSYFNFDLNETVKAFKNESANEILQDWKSSTKKKQTHKQQTITSTPKKSLNIIESSKIDESCTTPTSTNSHLNVIESSQSDISGETESKNSREEDKICSIFYHDIPHEIKNCERSIKEYEIKIEKCSNNVLLNYYISSCTKLQERINMLLEVYKQKLDVSKLSEEITKLSLKVDYILQQNNDRLINDLDCWDTSSTRTAEEQEEFKNNLIVYYQCGQTNTKKIKCMVLNTFFDRNLVRASHIWKSSTKGIGLRKFKLKESDINNTRNGLLMYKSIEKAFDNKKLCFLYDPFVGNLYIKILCNELREKFIMDEKTRTTVNELRTFNDIDHAVLHLPPDVFPYRRLLNWHGRCSFKNAKANKWINEDEHLEDFFHLSDLISLPGDDINE